MCSRVLVLLVLAAMSRNHGTMSFVFGPLAAFTSPQDASSPAPTTSTLPWTVGVDATTVASTTTTTTTTTMKPFIRRRPTSNRRRPVHGNIVFPTDDNFASFTETNPLLNSQNNKDYNLLTLDRGSVNTEQRFSPGLTPRPVRPKHASQESDDAIVFDGPSSSPNVGGRRRVRPPGHPMVFGPLPVGLDVSTPGLPSDAPSGFPPDFPSPPPPCPCPTTSESNPVCVEIQGERVTMSNLSEFKCAQMCVGEADVKLLFLARCQKVIIKLHPFIHD